MNDFDALRRIVPSIREATEDAIGECAPFAGRELSVARDGVPAPAFWYPIASESAPLVIYLHGGGFAFGDCRKSDALMAWTARAYGVAMLGVNYRLAPEHPFPSALHDVADTVEWCADHAAKLGIDPARIYLLGFSAGADLAFASALLLRREHSFALAGIIAHYPFLDCATDPQSKGGREIDLPGELTQAFNAWYVSGCDPADALLSPVYAKTDEIALLPPCAIVPVVGDSLFDEAKLMADKLVEAGVPCAFQGIEGAYHGYIEDAANPAVYAAVEMPETIAARPKNYYAIAGMAYEASLQRFFKRLPGIGPFPGFTRGAQDVPVE
ncbi:MAG: alpha/beta hydrolase [Eggerthellaceae bacterium]|jgi:acetyl esterase|nr:alpha/beta hydrolase [Eggerthellaceae bacterium]